MTEKQTPNSTIHSSFNSSFSNYSIKNNLNDVIHGISNLPNYGGLGGNTKLWKNLNQLGPHVEPYLPQREGDYMEAENRNVNKKRVYYPPYTLDPAKTSFKDIRKHSLERQDKAESTTNKYINQAKIMRDHQIIPVDFKNPHWTNFFKYMDYIKVHEGVTPHVLNNRRKAWRMFCKAWGTDKEWPIYKLPHIPDRTRTIYVPQPEIVRQILQYKYTKNNYLNKLIQYHFFVGFMIGVRPEKELIILDVDDVDLDEEDNYTITVVEPKKGLDARTLDLERTIAVSKVHKSFKNYIDCIRPKFANSNENALLVNPETGERWTENKLRHNLLYKYGKRVTTKYYPYCMRHFCATARCVEWHKDNLVLERVQYWMGHKKLDQTIRYLHLARSKNNGKKGSWLSRALKRHKNAGGMPGSDRVKRQTEKKGVVVQNTPYDFDGPGGI